jgi:hypothetical protein
VAERPEDARRDSGQRTILWVAASAAILVLAVAAFAALRPDGPASVGRGGDASRSDAAPATSTASVAVTGPPSADPTASGQPTPARTVDVYGEADAASREMRIAIAAAKGGRDGLKGKEAKALEDGLDRFDRALAQRDPTAARNEASKVAAQVTRLIDRRAVSAGDRERLRTAATTLVEAADALPA